MKYKNKNWTFLSFKINFIFYHFQKHRKWIANVINSVENKICIWIPFKKVWKAWSFLIFLKDIDKILRVQMQ